MKILVICQYYYPEQFRINDICETLVKKGNEVTVLTGLPNYPKGKIPKEYKFFKKRKENINGVEIIRTWEIGRKKGIIFRILNYLSYMVSATAKSIFIKKDFDIIFVYQLSPIFMAVPGIVYKNRTNKRLIMYCLDLWPDSIKSFGIKESTTIYKIIDKISKKIYGKADKILVSSQKFQGKINVNVPMVYLPQYAEEVLKKKEKIEDVKTNFVFAGNIGKAQSIDTILKAAKELKDKNKIVIHIIGDGSELELMRKMAEELNLKNVKFYGKKSIEEMQYYYNLADAMLVTLCKDEFASRTLPGKVQACMATGNPIIAAADGETQDVIEKSNCGYCVPAEDYKLLSKKLLQFSKLNAEEKKKYGINALKYYNENFEKKIIIEKLIKIFGGEE